MSDEHLSNFFSKAGTSARKSSGMRGEIANAPDAAVAASKENDPRFDGGYTDGVRRWAASDTYFWAAKQTFDELPAGLYKCGEAPGIGCYLDKQPVRTDTLLVLPDEVSATVLSEFTQFWTLKKSFLEHGFLHKRGFMLWGPPGSGKTSLIQLMIQTIIEKMNGIVVYIDHPQIASRCLQMARKVEQDRPFICVLEDLDALVEKWGENEYLSLLDGESQVNNVIFVATTNYPEKLDKRFVDRPSRFDTITYVGMPNSDARKAYFEAKTKLTADDLDLWVRKSEGFSIAHLREMIISVNCFGKSLDATVKRLSLMKETKPSSEDSPDRTKVGFG